MSYKEEEAVAEERDNNLITAYTANASSRSDSRLYVINSLLPVYTSLLRHLPYISFKLQLIRIIICCC